METTAVPTPSEPTGMRNTFLTIICILTFIGSGWGVIKAIRDYVTADTIATMANGALKNVQTQMDQQKAPDFVKDIASSVSDYMSPDNIRKTSILECISNLLTLFGAILMWRLKKAGFFLYIAGTIVLVVTPLALGKLIGIISGSMIGLIGLVFIVLYAVNLKYMDK